MSVMRDVHLGPGGELEISHSGHLDCKGLKRPSDTNENIDRQGVELL